MAEPAFVEIEHPDVEPSAFVHPSSVPVWRNRGWTVIEGGADDEPEVDPFYDSVDPEED